MHERVQGVALRRDHLLAHAQPERGERGGHLPLQDRRAHRARGEAGAVARGELGRQRGPRAAAAPLELEPELPLVQLAAAFEREALALRVRSGLGLELGLELGQG